jgi:hypothetical protein
MAERISAGRAGEKATGWIAGVGVRVGAEMVAAAVEGVRGEGGATVLAEGTQPVIAEQTMRIVMVI